MRADALNRALVGGLAVAATLLGTRVCCLGQNIERVGAQQRRAQTAAKVTADPDSYGRKMLELAEAEAGALRGGMRAMANLRLARAYQSKDKKKALEFLERAFLATREIDDDKLSTRGDLQVEILKLMATLDASRAEELLAQVDARRRAEVLQSLLGYYQQNKQVDRAIDVIYRISGESEFPYNAAAPVLAALPPERSSDLIQMFSTALASYRQHADRKQALHPSQDLTVLVTRFSKRVPPQLVKEAISEILKQADPEGNQNATSMRITLSSSAGAATFSNYEYKLFELVPILRELDNDEAERLLKRDQAVAETLAKFPDGIMQASGARMSIASGGPGAGGSASAWMAAEAGEYALMQKLLADVEAHPEQALANVNSLPSKSRRAEALLQIAQAAWKKNPGTAKTALRQLLELAPDLRLDDQIHMLFPAADLYLKMGATEDAKRVVEKQLEAAAALLKQDTDADDPNQALKAYWPSTNAYASALRTAGQISPAWAFTLLKDLPDSEIRFCSEMTLATTWLQLSLGKLEVTSATKKGVSTRYQ